MDTLFLDIETTPEYPTLSEVPLAGQLAFAKKFSPKVVAGQYKDLNEAYDKEAALHAEFAKIICVAFGSVVLDTNNQTKKIYIRGVIGTEAEILKKVSETLNREPSYICAHNGMAFDFPFICRRLLINKMPLPNILDIGSKKPWEVAWKDTAVMWKFNDYKSYASLITLCYVFGVESPKQEIDGSQVAQAFLDGKIELIKRYCMEDVRALIEVYRSIEGLSKIEEIVYLP